MGVAHHWCLGHILIRAQLQIIVLFIHLHNKELKLYMTLQAATQKNIRISL